MTERLSPRNERGFTLVETLVVVLIIAVLVGVALAMYLNQRTKAQDAEAKSAVAVTARAFQVWQQEHGTYEGAGRQELAGIESTIGTARGLVVAGTADGYRISVDSAAGTAGGGPFKLEHSATGTDRTCARAGVGGCPDSGRW